MTNHPAGRITYLCMIIGILSLTVSAQLTNDPLPYAPIANPLPDTIDQLPRDTLNLIFSPIRLNQAGYRPQDTKYFYYLGSASTFTVINDAGTTVGNGTLRSIGLSTSGQLEIRASNNAQLVSGGDTRYIIESPEYSGPLSEGIIPDLPSGTYRIVVGSATSHPFVIDERVYSWVRDALLKFYGVNRCGDSQSWFHPPCHLKDAVTGGWHDCGDHLKEGATMSYTAAVLGLAAAAFADHDADVYSANQGITQVTDGIPDILYEAKHGADFILRSYDRANGQVGAMVTSIGGFGNEGCGDDHMWWGRPENQDMMPMDRGGPPRCARNEPVSTYLGKYAANLAFVSRQYRPYDAAYADRCLEAAKAIYAFTKPRMDDTSTSAYNGANSVHDDLAFGCLALLWATGERQYLDELCFDKTIGSSATPGNKALFEGGWFTNKDPLFYHATANTDWGSVQTHVLWGFYRLILEDEQLCSNLGLSDNERLSLIEKTAYNLMANLGSVGLGNQQIELPNSGIWVPSMVKYSLPWFTMHTQMEWVWNRYQAGNITEMYYYYDMASRIQGLELPNTPSSTNWKAQEVKEILIRMLDYQIGVNPWDISMIYGVGEKNFNHPHHRAANPEGKNVPGAFYAYRPPVGALQGGRMPTTSLYEEYWGEYHTSETGIDGTTNILMPVVGLAREDTIGSPSATVRIVYVGCDEAIIEVRQSRFGTATVRYGTGLAVDKAARSDTTGVFHRIILSNLTNGTVYNFDVQVADLFGRDSIIKYLDEDKNLVPFTFTTLQNCPANADIANVKVCKVTSDSAEIFWYTPNGEFDSRVTYGEERPPTTVQNGDIAGHPVRFHYVKIGNLKEKTTYYFYVESGDSRDDNNGQLYTFTTPVMHVDFDVRMLRYYWGELPGAGINIVNQDVKAYDSLEVRLYFRAKEGFEKDLAPRLDICVLYREDGFQQPIEGALKDAVLRNIYTSKPVQMPDTYNPDDQTYAYYLALPLWGVMMHSQSRIRLDVIFDSWEPERLVDHLEIPPQHEISDLDWSFGPHSKALGDPVDYPGVPILPKEDVDASYFLQPINYYVTIYRKNEYVWGYSPSHEENKTKKTQYFIETQVTAPLNNPSADYVFYKNPLGIVNVSGWAKVEPVDGTLNDIWVNGVRQVNPSSLFTFDEATQLYNFDIPVPVHNGRNNVDITLFAGPPATCEECYGCAVSNHSFFVEFQGAKQYPSLLVLRDELMQPMSDTARPDTTKFHVVVTDRNGNQDPKAVDVVTIWIKNEINGDSIAVICTETGDSTGIFQTGQPIAVVNRQPSATGPQEISMNGGDRVRIWYIDPTDETDSSEVYLYSKASYPLAYLGWLKDTDGDGSADLLKVQYNSTLTEAVDSISIAFPTAATVVTAKPSTATFSFSGTAMSAVFTTPLANGVTGFASSLTGSGTSYLTSAGLVRTSVFQLNDSIGPVLTGQAIAMERLGSGYDTLTFTFSERIKAKFLEGTALLLRRGGSDVPLQIIGVMSEQSGTFTVIIDAGDLQFTAGDTLRLNSASKLTDISGNLPHVNNRGVPIIIRAIPPQITSAWYQDTDVNGSIDRVTILFSKPVTSSGMMVLLRWNDNLRVTVQSDRIAVVTGVINGITVAVDEQVTGTGIITAGTMDCYVLYPEYPADTVYGPASDSAAPVIATASFNLFNGDTLAGVVDTLRMLFSETVLSDPATPIGAFNLRSRSTGQGYTFRVSGSRLISQREYLYFGKAEGVAYPQAGDSIWLQPEAMVTDFKGNRQTSPLNRRVAVSVGIPDLTFDMFRITFGPVPFNPMAGEQFRLKMIPVSRMPVALDSISIRAVIYDKVGNLIADRSLLPITGVGTPHFGLEWNGTNRRGRIVGNGTYAMFLYYKQLKNKPIMIGVRNGR